MNIKSLGYIGIESMKMDEWRSYCTDFMGLMDVSPGANELRFRMDDLGWRISIKEGDKEDLAFAGFDAALRIMPAAGATTAALPAVLINFLRDSSFLVLVFTTNLQASNCFRTQNNQAMFIPIIIFR